MPKDIARLKRGELATENDRVIEMVAKGDASLFESLEFSCGDAAMPSLLFPRQDVSVLVWPKGGTMRWEKVDAIEAYARKNEQWIEEISRDRSSCAETGTRSVYDPSRRRGAVGPTSGFLPGYFSVACPADGKAAYDARIAQLKERTAVLRDPSKLEALRKYMRAELKRSGIDPEGLMPWKVIYK